MLLDRSSDGVRRKRESIFCTLKYFMEGRVEVFWIRDLPVTRKHQAVLGPWKGGWHSEREHRERWESF